MRQLDAELSDLFEPRGFLNRPPAGQQGHGVPRRYGEHERDEQRTRCAMKRLWRARRLHWRRHKRWASFLGTGVFLGERAWRGRSDGAALTGALGVQRLGVATGKIAQRLGNFFEATQRVYEGVQIEAR